MSGSQDTGQGLNPQAREFKLQDSGNNQSYLSRIGSSFNQGRVDPVVWKQCQRGPHDQSQLRGVHSMNTANRPYLKNIGGHPLHSGHRSDDYWVENERGFTTGHMGARHQEHRLSPGIMNLSLPVGENSFARPSQTSLKLPEKSLRSEALVVKYSPKDVTAPRTESTLQRRDPRMCGTAYTNEVSRCILCPMPDMDVTLSHNPGYIRNNLQLDNQRDGNLLGSGDILQSVTDTMRRGFCLPLAKSHETYPSPTIVLDKLSKHVESLMRLGHSGVELKDVIVEGDVGLCMDLGMKGLIGKEALNPWKTLSINIPDQPFLKQIPKPPLGSVAGDWTCSCGRENWAKRSVCSRCFPGIEPVYKAIVYNRVRPIFELVTSQLREVHLRLDAEKLSSEERRLRRRETKP